MSQEETEPLIYVDSTSHERSDRRKKVLVAGLTVVLSVALCLAIAIPLATSGGKASSVNYQKVAPALFKSVAYAGSNRTGWNFTLVQQNFTFFPIRNATTVVNFNTTATSATSATSATPTTSTTSTISATPTTSATSAISATSATSVTSDISATSANSSVSATSATSAPTNKPTSGLPTSFPSSACPIIPKGRRFSIDVGNMNGKLMFELARIQTWNAPAYVSSISCSTMELDLERTNSSGKVAANGTLKLGWNDRSSFFERNDRKSLSIPLEGVDSPYDWFEATPSGQDAQVQCRARPEQRPRSFPSISFLGELSCEDGIQSCLAHLSILAEIDQYVLTYECFPETTFPGVAYVVHLYSYLPQRGTNTLGEALLWLANAWGLNPAEAPIVRIQQSDCEYNNA